MPWVHSCPLWVFILLARKGYKHHSFRSRHLHKGRLTFGYNKPLLILPASLTAEASFPLNLLKDQSRTRAIFQSPSRRGVEGSSERESRVLRGRATVPEKFATSPYPSKKAGHCSGSLEENQSTQKASWLFYLDILRHPLLICFNGNWDGSFLQWQPSYSGLCGHQHIVGRPGLRWWWHLLLPQYRMAHTPSHYICSQQAGREASPCHH